MRNLILIVATAFSSFSVANEYQSANPYLEVEAAIENYANSVQVQNLIEYTINNLNPTARNKCIIYVNNALLATKFISTSLRGNAINALPLLPRRGFKNLLDIPGYKDLYCNSPDQAPKGAVFVYNYVMSGVNYGHIEIKIGAKGKGGYASYRFSPKAFYGTPLRGPKCPLVGVFIKPSTN
ncbi:MAG: hypothetical protein AB7O96_16140 [Pseudobdellovibrionaceae bacterium]